MSKQTVQQEPAAEADDALQRAIGLRLGIRRQRLLQFFQQIIEHGRQGFVEVAEAFRRFGRTLSLLGLGNGEIELPAPARG